MSLDSPNTAPTLIALATLLSSIGAIVVNVMTAKKQTKLRNDQTTELKQDSKQAREEVKSAITDATGTFRIQAPPKEP